MVAPLFGLLAGAGLLGAGFLGGRSSGGGSIEIGTTKKSTIPINASQTSTQTTFSPTTNKTFDFQFINASGGSTVSTKKSLNQELSPNTSPSFTPILNVNPQLAQGGGLSGDSKNEGLDLNKLLLFGGLGVGAFLLLKDGK